MKVSKNYLNLKFFVAISLFFVIFLLSVNINPVFAESSSFTHVIKAFYEIKNDKSASVVYDITTTNKVGNDYLKSFTFKLPFRPKNVSSDGSATPVVVKQVRQMQNRNIYFVDIDVTNPPYGLNNSYSWKVKFDVDGFLFDHGMQNALILPTFSDDPSITSFEVNVRFPSTLGTVRYIYGNGAVSVSNGMTSVNFKDRFNESQSFTILLGSDQEYIFETTPNAAMSQIFLPLANNYQEVIYTDFPQREITSNDRLNPRILYLRQNENIRAIIKTHQLADTEYSKEFDDITNFAFIEKLAGKIGKNNQSNYETAKKAFELLSKNFELNDIVTDENTRIDISAEKKGVNPAELNKIFREILTYFNIENRGVYGYVFPEQAFQRAEFMTEQHIWSEFWDGSKWVVVDPTWYIASKGNDYFDKNAFHHVKYGDYHNLSDLNFFFSNSRLVKLTPAMIAENIEKTLSVEMLAYDGTHLNKEFRVIIKNNSNQPVKISKIFPNLSLEGVKIKESDFNIDKVLFPRSQLNLTIPLEYGLRLKDEEGPINIKVDYEDLSKVSMSKTFSHNINIRSNISSYLSEIILGLFLVFMFVSVGSFVVYRSRVKVLTR